MEERPANADMIQGYLDGLNMNCPDPSDNRSFSYRHGFANGRDDRAGRPRTSADELRRLADEAMDLDDGCALHCVL
jgi:hypothetical protein